MMQATHSANLSHAPRGSRHRHWRRSTPLARGERGTVQTLRLMASFVRRDAQDEELRRYATGLVQAVAGHDFNGEIRAAFLTARDLRYQRDPVNIERVQDAWRTLELGQGDCDDKVVLLCSLLHCLGHQTRFAVCGQHANRWTHVYCEVQTREGWLPLDPTPEQAEPGWELPAPYKAVFEIVPAISLNLRVVRRPNSLTPKPLLPGRRVDTRQRAAVFSPGLRDYLTGAAPCRCGRYIWQAEDDAADEGLGADQYEWKVSGSKCELQKKKCGFWCKIGRGFKKVGSFALRFAPLALAPFTAGGSLALTGAAGAAANIGAQAAQAASQLLTQRYTAGLPGDAQIKEPEGQCLAILQREAEEEAKRIAAEEMAKREAAEASSARTVQAQVRANESGASAGLSFGNPLVLAAVAVGGVLLLTKR